jgi:hypothetical protein
MSDDTTRGDEMGRRMKETDLRDEFRSPETRGLMIAFLGVTVGRLQAIDAYTAAGVRSMNYTDLVILIYCFIWTNEGGAKVQHIVNTIGRPRRTVRDSLDKLAAQKCLIREGSSYYPTKFATGVANTLYEPLMRELRGLCDAYEVFRNAQKGNNARAH